jgi:hypothetical protein
MILNLKEFLNTVITSPSGYFCLSAADKNFDWEEFWYKWPDDQDIIVNQAHRLAEQRNVYYSTHLFTAPQALKANVLPTRTIQVDLDEANALNFVITPTILVQTSPGRHQGYYILENTPEQEELERLSRKLTYAIPMADPSGWSLGHRVRLPETYNYKYDVPQLVTIVTAAVKRIDIAQLENLPELGLEAIRLNDEDIEWIKTPHVDLSEKFPPQETLVSLFKSGIISQTTRMTYNKVQTDRSAALWRLMQECFAAGLGRDDIYWVAYNSENNKWRKYPRDLRKDVVRAERKRGEKTSNLRKLLRDIRNDTTTGSVDDRLDKISELIIHDLNSRGRFYHARGGQSFYCETELGLPAEIPGNNWETKCTLEYGVNSSTHDFRYVTKELIAHVRNIDSRTEISSLSYYDPSAHTVLLHTGGRDVFIIRQNSLSTVPNGSSDILFHVNEIAEPFSLDYRTELPRKWYEILFDSTLEYVDGVNRKHALALITAWFIYIILRKGFITRPLLGLIGQPGSGKSVLNRIIYKTLYGKSRDLHQATTEKDYDILVSKYPLVSYDNVDSAENLRWLPDRLAASTTETEVEIRQLYSDYGTVILRRSAMISLTAHDPKFLRADVVDRLLMLTFRRRKKDDGTDDFLEESVIMATLAYYRNAIWAAIVKDLQKILNTPRPADSEVPGYRIKDFAVGGVWIARALGIEEDFVNGINANKSKQSNSVLEQEMLLVQVLGKWIDKYPDVDYVTVSELWNNLAGAVFSNTEQDNFKRIYKNSAFFGNRLYILHHNLTQQFDISYKRHPTLESRLWRIKRKGTS